MRGRLFVVAILVVAPVLAFSQSPKTKIHSKITGCLTSSLHPDEYELVDEKGVTVFSPAADCHAKEIFRNTILGA